MWTEFSEKDAEPALQLTARYNELGRGEFEEIAKCDFDSDWAYYVNDFKFDVLCHRGQGCERIIFNLDDVLGCMTEDMFEEFITKRRNQRKLRRPDKISRALKRWDIKSLGMDGV